jgi:hypothetical protein
MWGKERAGCHAFGAGLKRGKGAREDTKARRGRTKTGRHGKGFFGQHVSDSRDSFIGLFDVG